MGLPTSFKNIFESYTATQYYKERSARQDPEIRRGAARFWARTSGRRLTCGPSFIDRLTQHRTMSTAISDTVLLDCHYPIDADLLVPQYGITVEKSEDVPEDARAVQMGIALGDFVKMGLEQECTSGDVRPASTTCCCAKRMVLAYQLRRWYEQFYVDAADVTPNTCGPLRSFEIDTFTRPREAWR